MCARTQYVIITTSLGACHFGKRFAGRERTSTTLPFSAPCPPPPLQVDATAQVQLAARCRSERQNGDVHVTGSRPIDGFWNCKLIRCGSCAQVLALSLHSIGGEMLSIEKQARGGMYCMIRGNIATFPWEKVKENPYPYGGWFLSRFCM